MAPPPVPALDARDSSHRPILRGWLALQETFPLRPHQARLALERAGGDPERAAGPIAHSALDAHIESLARCAALAIPFGSTLYPPALAPLPDAPALLFVQGEPAALAARALAIVGARAATPYGLAVAREVARAAVSPWRFRAADRISCIRLRTAGWRVASASTERSSASSRPGRRRCATTFR